MLRSAHLLIALAVGGNLSAEAQSEAHLVRDIAPGAAPRSSYAPIQGVASDSRAFFFAATQDAGVEPWVTDGTPENTYRIRDIRPGNIGITGRDSTRTIPIYIDGRFAFSTSSGEVWSTNTTATEIDRIDLTGEKAISVLGRVHDDAIVLSEGEAGVGLRSIDLASRDSVLLHRFDFGGETFLRTSTAAQFVEVGNRTYFVASEDPTGKEVWQTTGSVEGTKIVRDLVIGPSGSDPMQLCAAAGKLFFLVGRGSQIGLWVTAPDQEPEFLLSYPVGELISTLQAAEDGVFLIGNFLSGSEVKFSDGTREGTRDLASFGSVRFPGLTGGVAVGNTLFFIVDDVFDGKQLVALSGLSGELRRFEMFTDRVDNVTETATRWGDRLVFTELDDEDRLTIWTIEPGEATASRITDLGVAANGDRPIGFLPFVDVLFYSGGDSESGIELMRTDVSGTQAGMVANIAADIKSSYPSLLTAAATSNGPRVYFSPGAGILNNLWISDGTTPGTLQITHPDLGRIDSPFSVLDAPLGLDILGHFVFESADSNRMNSIWSHDGSRGSAVKLRETREDTGSLIHAGNAAYFIVVVENTVKELWRTEGTPESTARIAELPREVNRLVAVNDSVLSLDRYQSRIIYTTDVERGRTETLVDLKRAAPIRGFTEMGTLSLFSAYDRERGAELWVTDGTTLGTRVVADINPGQFFSGGEPTRGMGSSPHNLVGLGDQILFFADDGLHGFELWRSDATAQGTWLVRDTIPGPDGPIEIQRSLSGAPLPSDTQMVAATGRVFFVIDDGIHGREPWTSDGSTEGTLILRDIVPGPFGSNPTSLFVVDDALIFSACDDLGCEVWTSDGSPEGTKRLADVNPGERSSNPYGFVGSGGTIYFGAYDQNGTEIWGLPRSSLPSPAPLTPRPTRTPEQPSPSCAGDCDGDRAVAVAELVRVVAISLGKSPLSSCPSVDLNGDHSVRVNEIVTAVSSALQGCTDRAAARQLR